MGYITDNLGTIGVAAALIIIIALAIRSIRKGKKEGGGSSCSGCSGECWLKEEDAGDAEK